MIEHGEQRREKVRKPGSQCDLNITVQTTDCAQNPRRLGQVAGKLADKVEG